MSTALWLQYIGVINEIFHSSHECDKWALCVRRVCVPSPYLPAAACSLAIAQQRLYSYAIAWTALSLSGSSITARYNFGVAF